ncbi:MAG: hypothetical protein ACEPOW_03660 [Bacteroidales bacterium]
MKHVQLIANIVLIAIGLIFGVVFFRPGFYDLSLIMFSIALASILYQLLGGIKESNSFNLGAIKFGGSAAILIGFMYFLDQVIYPSQEEQNSQKHVQEIFSKMNWIPININSGKIHEFHFPDIQFAKVFPKKEVLTLLERNKIPFNPKIIESPNINPQSDLTFKNALNGKVLKADEWFAIHKETKTPFCLEAIYNKTKTIPDPEKNKIYTKNGFYKDTYIPVEKLREDTLVSIKLTSEKHYAEPSETNTPFRISHDIVCARFSVLYDNKPLVTERKLKKGFSCLKMIDTISAYLLTLEQCRAEDCTNKEGKEIKAFSKWVIQKVSFDGKHID